MDSKNYLSIKNTTALKGILAIFVVISHIYSSSSFSFSNPFLVFVFGSIFGYVPVSVFFFLSGYGAMISFKKKGESYMRAFPRNRLLPLYLISFVMIAVYTLVNWLVYKNFNLVLLIQSLTLGGTVIKYGWYLQTILVLYLVFWVCFSLKIKDSMKIGLFCASIALLYVLCFACGVEPTCYATAPCMVFGVLWSVFSPSIDKIINNHFRKWICIAFALLMVVLVKFAASILPASISYVLQVTLTAIFFTVAIVVFLKGISLCNFITTYLGKISLEIYITQGLSIILLGYFSLSERNVLLYGCLTMIITILFATGVHPISQKINKCVRKNEQKN